MKLEDRIKEKSEFNLDYNKINNKIEFEKYTKEESKLERIFSFLTTKKIAISFVLAVILIVGILIIPSALNNKNNNELNQNQNIPGDNVGTNNDFSYIKSYNENNILGIAAYKEFDNSKVMKMSNRIINKNKLASISKLDDDIVKVSYPFEYIKIVSASKFSVNIESIEDEFAENTIKSNCGLGALEVVYAEFDAYTADGTVLLTDTLISIRGYNGYYTILANSIDFIGNHTYVFSSHKKLLSDEVNKDYTPPILTVILEEEKDERYLFFESSETELGFSNFDKALAFKNTSIVEKVSKNTAYTMLELSRIPVISCNAEIVNIDLENKNIHIKSNNNLECIYYDDFTEGVSVNNLQIGDNIIIEYDYLFEGYNPFYTYVNSIEFNADI